MHNNINLLKDFTPAPLPYHYSYVAELAERSGPRIIREALKTYGLKEISGAAHSREILGMAEYLGGVIEDFYTRDEIPWCGLAVSYWIKQAGFEPPINYSQVRARGFEKWGRPVKTPSFGDIMVFWRGQRDGSEGHVGLYVGQDSQGFHILGGNQGNEVSIARIHKNRFITARRCPWRFLQPRGVKPIILEQSKYNSKFSQAES